MRFDGILGNGSLNILEHALMRSVANKVRMQDLPICEAKAAIKLSYPVATFN